MHTRAVVTVGGTSVTSPAEHTPVVVTVGAGELVLDVKNGVTSDATVVGLPVAVVLKPGPIAVVATICPLKDDALLVGMVTGDDCTDGPMDDTARGLVLDTMETLDVDKLGEADVVGMADLVSCNVAVVICRHTGWLTKACTSSAFTITSLPVTPHTAKPPCQQVTWFEIDGKQNALGGKYRHHYFFNYANNVPRSVAHPKNKHPDIPLKSVWFWSVPRFSTSTDPLAVKKKTPSITSGLATTRWFTYTTCGPVVSVTVTGTFMARSNSKS